MTESRISPLPGDTAASPVRLDAEKLGGKGLRDAPAAASEGSTSRVQSEFDLKSDELFRGDISVAVIESNQPGTLEVQDFAFDEFVLVLEGTMTLTDSKGETQSYATGDSFVIPKGFSGRVEIVSEKFRELMVVETKSFLADSGSR